MQHDKSRVYLDSRQLPLLLELLAEVSCARCGHSGIEHGDANHLLIDPETERVGDALNGAAEQLT